MSTERLLILNQSMNENHSALAHQLDVARELSKYFESVQVVTASASLFGKKEVKNLKVIDLDWERLPRIKKIILFYSKILIVIVRFRPQVIFSHMTTFQSLLVAPISRVLRIPHYLWYAHKQNSLSLRIAHLLTNGVITSTINSYPISGKKVSIIGQGISLSKFFLPLRHRYVSKKLVHVGRIDKSKKIEEIVKVALDLRCLNPEISVDFIGKPLREDSDEYLASLMTKFHGDIEQQFVRFIGPMRRDDLRDTLCNYDLFLHAYEGSMDKVLLEAALLGLPVVTLNSEFNKLVSTPTHLSQGSLIERSRAWLGLDPLTQLEISKQRQEIVRDHHSLDTWTRKLVAILKNAKN
jgi:glycosyltransferase involved in cell wall biosynthesis